MAINRVDFGGNTLIDLTGDTLESAEQLLKGIIAHAKDGSVITGRMGAGGGGGGGKIASGTFIPAETTGLSMEYKIEHNCGFTPDVFIVTKKESSFTQYSIKFAVSFPVSFLTDDYLSIDRSNYIGHAYGWGSSSYSTVGGSSSIFDKTTDKFAYIKSNSHNNKVIAGESYTWIAIGMV